MENLTENILFLDIETAAISPSFEELDSRLQKHWLKKAAFIKDSEVVKPDELFFQKAAIYSEFAKVIVIAVGFIDRKSEEPTLRIKSFYGDNEGKVLKEFCQLINTKLDVDNIRLCAHNGKEFDYPFLGRRLLVNGIPLPKPLQLSGKKPWEVNHFDTLEMWKFGDRKNFTSLDLLAALFNIESSKSEIDGSKVNEYYYQHKDLDSINNYCKQDVVVLAQLFLKMNYLKPISKDNVIFVD